MDLDIWIHFIESNIKSICEYYIASLVAEESPQPGHERCRVPARALSLSVEGTKH